MAKITFLDSFWSEFDDYVHNAYVLFGRKTAKKWTDSLQAIMKRLKVMPESYSYMMIGKNVYKNYRGAIIMRNFKLVYVYDDNTNVVKVLTVLDMRQDSKKLKSILKTLQ